MVRLRSKVLEEYGLKRLILRFGRLLLPFLRRTLVLGFGLLGGTGSGKELLLDILFGRGRFVGELDA